MKNFKVKSVFSIINIHTTSLILIILAIIAILIKELMNQDLLSIISSLFLILTLIAYYFKIEDYKPKRVKSKIVCLSETDYLESILNKELFALRPN